MGESQTGSNAGKSSISRKRVQFPISSTFSETIGTSSN